jgi:tryptophan synthase beta subunit
MIPQSYTLASELEETVLRHKGATNFVRHAAALALDNHEFDGESWYYISDLLHQEADKINDLLAQYFHALDQEKQLKVR